MPSARRPATGSAHSLPSTPRHTCPGISAGNNLVVLSCRNEAELLQLQARARELDAPTSVFQEPDFDMEHTALAVAGTTSVQRMLSQLPLALRAA